MSDVVSLTTRPTTAPGPAGDAGGPEGPMRAGDNGGNGKRPLRLATVFAIGVVAVLGGLLAWGAFSDWHSQQPQAFYSSSIQPYDVPPGTPVVPANTPTAHGATAASQKAAMITATPRVDVTLAVNPPPLGGLYGPDGQVHDAFVPAYFTVRAGQTVHVTVHSYDTAWHTFSAPTLNLDVWIHPEAGTKPGTTTFTFTAPKAGNYYWLCELPCDPYAMSSGGYMEGEIHAVGA